MTNSNDNNRKSETMIDCLDFNAPTGKNLYPEIQQDNGDRYMVKMRDLDEVYF